MTRTHPFRVVRALLSILGVAALGTGVTAVFVSSNDAGAAALVVSGTVFVALALFLERVSSLKAGGVELTLRDVALIRAEADAADAAGQTELAADLRDQAANLARTMSQIAAEYEEVRSTQLSSWERTRKLERIMQRARQRAHDPGVSRESIEMLFADGGAGNRLAALAITQARPELASELTLTAAMESPQSSFEQWHSLDAIRGAIAADGLDDGARHRLTSLVAVALRSGRFGSEDSDRVRIAKRITGIV